MGAELCARCLPSYCNRGVYRGRGLGAITKDNEMIILEGPNGCGKTTLAQLLQRETDWPIVKFPTPRSAIEAVRNLDVLATLGDRIIADRHPMISDNIYCPIMFPSESPIPMERAAFDSDLVIYCRVPLSTAIKRHRYTADDPFYRHELEIFARYDALMYSIPHVKYNWLEGTEIDIIAKVREYAGV